MERIFFSRLIVFITMSIGFHAMGQEPYYVFKKTGTPAVNVNRLLQRGSVFSEKDTLYMGEKDYLLLVDEKGLLFEIDTPNKYAYSAILDYKRRVNDDSFTKKYFKYVWKQFTNQLDKKQEAGVVYREERTLKLIAPMDSVKLFSSEVQFSWKNTTDKKNVFFFLRDMKTGHLTKFGLTGNYLTLHLDNALLKPGQAYEWAVSTSSYPNLNTLEFNQLNLLSKEDYEQLENEMAALLKAFKLLGFSESEIQEALCVEYKYCR